MDFRMNSFFLVVLICRFIIIDSYSAWSFRDDNGPNYWKKRYADCSADSQQQSPIDIPNSLGRTYDKSLQEMQFTNYDKVFKAKAKNDGYNIRFQEVYTSSDKKMYIEKGALDTGVKYIVTEFHFQWSLDNKDETKIESGHRLEGKQFPMELHIVHYRDDYDSLDRAKDYQDGVAIVVFFIEEGEEANENYQTLTNHLEELKFKTADRKPYKVDGFSLKSITNKNIKTAKDEGKHLEYYHYEGTSTSPPCYHVKWFVFKDPIKLDKFQINMFRGTMRVKNASKAEENYDAYDKMGPNFRPLQKLGTIKVYESVNSHSSGNTVTTGLLSTFLPPSQRPATCICDCHYSENPASIETARLFLFIMALLCALESIFWQTQHGYHTYCTFFRIHNTINEVFVCTFLCYCFCKVRYRRSVLRQFVRPFVFQFSIYTNPSFKSI